MRSGAGGQGRLGAVGPSGGSSPGERGAAEWLEPGQGCPAGAINPATVKPWLGKPRDRPPAGVTPGDELRTLALESRFISEGPFKRISDPVGKSGAKRGKCQVDRAAVIRRNLPDHQAFRLKLVGNPGDARA